METNNSAPTNPDDAVIRQALASMRHVAVVGFSANETRASHGVARFLQGQKLAVTGVNPGLAGTTVMDIPVVAQLADITDAIDIVDIFRRQEAVPEIVAAAIAVGAQTVWLQEGIVHEGAAAQARAAGLTCIQNRCLYQEWLRLMNG